MSAPQKIPVDSMLHARWVIPVEPRATVLQHHTLVIENQRIRDILSTEQAKKRYSCRSQVNLDNHALIPGLINAHGHAAMTLFRGLADDIPLMTWLNNHIWPAEQRWVSEDFVNVGSELAIAEMLLGGTTCFADMYFFPNIMAKVAHQRGIRAHLYAPIADFPSAWASTPDEYFHRGLKLADDYRNHPLIRVGFGPHAPYTVCNESLQRVKMLADELDAPIQIHLHETAKEVEDAVKQDRRRPIQRLDSLDLLSPRLSCVHMTQVDAGDIQLLADNSCHVIHCPESNLKLGSGICPVTQLMSSGVNVALGTDSAASNNNLDMLGEMQTAALLSKGVNQDASLLTAYETLRMATYQGAKALGIETQTGSLETGKAADITAVDLSDIRHQPVYDPISHLTYCCQSSDVSHVWVNGRLLVKGGKLTSIDSDALSRKVDAWRVKISAAETQQTLKF